MPYIPAVQNVATHAANLMQAGVDGLMLGWTLGGYPSPNLEAMQEVARNFAAPSESRDVPAYKAELVQSALHRIALKRFGASLAPAAVRAWRTFSEAFQEFPFDGGVVYNAPMQYGPSNLLWPRPTGYHASMVGFPYDDLEAWRGPYPSQIFIAQLEKVASGFEIGVGELKSALLKAATSANETDRQNLNAELNVAEGCAIHFRSTANQARFVVARRQLAEASSASEHQAALEVLKKLVRDESKLAHRLFELQIRDSRIGFEASNQYYYVPLDLVEKVLNCRDLIETSLA